MIAKEVPFSQDKRRIPLEGTIMVAHQPEFLPYLGNISKATMGDVYVILDELQYVKQHWQSRNKIRINGGEGWQWLIIPLKVVHKHILPTNEVVIDGDFWKKKHLKSIQMSYSKAPYMKEIFPEIVEIYERKHELLVEFLVDLIHYAFKKFKVNIPVYRSSELNEMGYSLEGKKSEYLIQISQVFGAKTFIFGRDGKEYYDPTIFTENGMLPVFQDFQHPVYSQIHSGEFIPYMSFIDLLFNHGPESIEILGKSNYTGN